jgi:hypothetical protein
MDKGYEIMRKTMLYLLCTGDIIYRACQYMVPNSRYTYSFDDCKVIGVKGNKVYIEGWSRPIHKKDLEYYEGHLYTCGGSTRDKNKRKIQEIAKIYERRLSSN